MRGSQEAFTELLRNNVSLLRRQFRSGTLVAEIATRPDVTLLRVTVDNREALLNALISGLTPAACPRKIREEL